MASKIKIDTKSLKSDATSIEKSINSMNRSLSDLKTSFIKLDSMWDGPASDTFKAQYNSDLVALRTIISNLSKINKYEDNARVKYDSCENKVAGIISGIKV